VTHTRTDRQRLQQKSEFIFFESNSSVTITHKFGPHTPRTPTTPPPSTRPGPLDGPLGLNNASTLSWRRDVFLMVLYGEYGTRLKGPRTRLKGQPPRRGYTSVTRAHRTPPHKVKPGIVFARNLVLAQRRRSPVRDAAACAFASSVANPLTRTLVECDTKTVESPRGAPQQKIKRVGAIDNSEWPERLFGPPRIILVIWSP
jgi:hypothetical protein